MTLCHYSIANTIGTQPTYRTERSPEEWICLGVGIADTERGANYVMRVPLWEGTNTLTLHEHPLAGKNMVLSPDPLRETIRKTPPLLCSLSGLATSHTMLGGVAT